MNAKNGKPQENEFFREEVHPRKVSNSNYLPIPKSVSKIAMKKRYFWVIKKDGLALEIKTTIEQIEE